MPRRMFRASSSLATLIFCTNLSSITSINNAPISKHTTKTTVIPAK